MERLTFFERYRVSVTDDGKPRELHRHGPAITYKAVDLQSGEPVALKVIPMAAISPSDREQFEQRARAAQHVEHANVARLLAFIVDAEDFVLVSEYPHGDTIASWVATQGPLNVDATLRVGLQVVSALQAAAFHGLTHAAIDPSNIIIVPGQTTDGGWPAIKLTNFDTSGLNLLTSDEETSAAGSAIAPQFASPEQLQNAQVTFPSEIYSLGATMCFMLTGLAPIGSNGGEARLPSTLRRLPRNVRELLLDMLQPNATERPQDPVAFAERIRECIASVDARRTGSRKIAAVPPLRTAGERRVIGFPKPLAIAAAIAGLAILSALLLAQPIRSAWQRHWDVSKIGVPVGVPDRVANNVATTAPAAVAAPAAQTAAPVSQTQEAPAQETTSRENTVAGSNANTSAPPAPSAPAAVDQAPALISTNDQNSAAAANSNSEENRIAANTQQTSEPHAPAEAPATTQRDEQPKADTQQTSQPEVASNQPSAAVDQHPQQTTTTRATKKTATTSKRRTATVAKDEPRDGAHAQSEPLDNAPPVPPGAQRARFVGTTRNGEWIFDAPVGTGTVALPSEDSVRSHARRHRRVEEGAVPAEGAEPTVRRALPVEVEEPAPPQPDDD